jgi:hypothetical protein
MESSGTNHWVAGPGAARSCANALFSGTARLPRPWVVVVALLLVSTGILTGPTSPWAPALGVGYAVGFVGAAYAATYLGLRRRTARRLPAGLALESEFGTDVVALRGPSAESRLEFDAIDRVRRCGEWVLLRQGWSQQTSCWPADLFPAADLARLQVSVAAQGERRLPLRTRLRPRRPAPTVPAAPAVPAARSALTATE